MGALSKFTFDAHAIHPAGSPASEGWGRSGHMVGRRKHVETMRLVKPGIITWTGPFRYAAIEARRCSVDVPWLEATRLSEILSGGSSTAGQADPKSHSFCLIASLSENHRKNVGSGPMETAGMEEF